MIKQQLNQLLDKEVDRKDFLKHVGVAIIAVAGVSTLMSNLTSLQGSSSTKGVNSGTKSTHGYGLSAYGR